MADDQDAPAPSPSPSTPSESSTPSAPLPTPSGDSGPPTDPHERLRARGLAAERIPASAAEARHLADALDAQDASERAAAASAPGRKPQMPGDGMTPDEDHPDPALPGEPGLTQAQRRERGLDSASRGEPGRPLEDEPKP